MLFKSSISAVLLCPLIMCSMPLKAVSGMLWGWLPCKLILKDKTRMYWTHEFCLFIQIIVRFLTWSFKWILSNMKCINYCYDPCTVFLFIHSRWIDILVSYMNLVMEPLTDIFSPCVWPWNEKTCSLLRGMWVFYFVFFF